MGTEHSNFKSDYVTTKFQFRIDNDSIKIDAYKQCIDPQFTLRGQLCSSIINEDYTTIFNNLIEQIT